MASPPVGSPPGFSPLSLPRQRPQAPTLALPNKSRKSSLVPSIGSAHPLRQTSFPPPDSLEAQHQAAEDSALNAYSPTADDVDDFSDSEITSAISGNFGDDAFNSKKRKRGDKKLGGRGRPLKQSSVRMGSVSIVNGEDGRSTTGGNKRGGTTAAPSVVTGDGNEEAEDDEDDDAAAAEETVALSAKELEDENQRKYLFRETVKLDHQRRYDVYNKVRIGKNEVRKLVNATLSQSVPPNVVTVVQAYAKMFAGMLIEGARDVQSEWMAAQPKRPDEEENRAFKRLRMMQPETVQDEDEEDNAEEPKTNREKLPNGSPADAKPQDVDSLPNGTSCHADTQATSSSATQPNGESSSETKRGDDDGEFDDTFDFEHAQPGAWGLLKYIDEVDRGPLLPDHLREALRRYKKSRAGGTVGFTGMSLGRTDVVAPRMGGKRLFR